MTLSDAPARLDGVALPPVRNLDPIVVLVPARSAAARDLLAAFDGGGWAHQVADDVDRTRWLVSIQKVALVVVVGDAALATSTLLALRETTAPPVVVVGDLTSAEVVALLDDGVDAVVDVDAPVDEVLARLGALIRRVGDQGPSRVRYLRSGPLLVDLHTQETSLDGAAVHLSPTEYRLLVFLMSHSQQVLATHLLVRRVWGWMHADGKNVLRIFVNRLRTKLGDQAHDPMFIASVRGIGYRFVRSVDEYGDGAEGTCGPTAVGPLVRSVSDLVLQLGGSTSWSEGIERTVTLVEASGYADGVALFRVQRDSMELIASRGMSDDWVRSVQGGVPLDETYASAHNVTACEPVQVADLQTDARFSSSAELALIAGYHAALFVPIMCEGRPWGQLGVNRRSAQPFDAAAAAYVGCAAALLGCLLEHAPS